MLEIRFSENVSYVGQKYIGFMYHVDHLENYCVTWRMIPRQEWVHLFIHTLDTVPKNWYTLVELQLGTID